MKIEDAIKFFEHKLSLGVEGHVYFTEREALKLAIKALKDTLK